MYTFLIDEKGGIYKCGFGAWKYAEVKEHLADTEGSFFKRFKSVGRHFNDVFISSCNSCLRGWNEHKRQEERKQC